MTEMMEIPGRAARPIDPVAFVIALVGAPLAFAVMFCWLLFIPVVAVFMGGIPYLVIGTPILLWALMRFDLDFLGGGGLGLLGVMLMGAAGLAAVSAGRIESDMLEIYFWYGLPHGFGWGGLFAVIYRMFRRPLYDVSL